MEKQKEKVEMKQHIRRILKFVAFKMCGSLKLLAFFNIPVFLISRKKWWKNMRPNHNKMCGVETKKAWNN